MIGLKCVGLHSQCQLTVSPVASARGPAGPSYAAATLQASNATSSASSVSKALGSSCKVRSSVRHWGVENERSWKAQPIPASSASGVSQREEETGLESRRQEACQQTFSRATHPQETQT